MNKISKTELVEGARDFRLMTRQMVDSVLSVCEYNRFLQKGSSLWVGYKTRWIEYENVERVAGETKWSFWKLFKYSLECIMAFSTVPLAISSFFGILFALIAVVGIVVVIVRQAVWGGSAYGWASTVCIILFVAGIQLFCIGILGQYLAKTYLETKRRPIYIAKETEKDIRRESADVIPSDEGKGEFMKAFLCRCLPLLLLFALIFTALAACATEPGGASGASEAGGASSGAESAAEGFPLEEKNFGGKEITVLCVDRHTYGVMQFVPDSELKANAVNDAVAERNNLIEEKYGLTIKAVGENFPIETLRLAVTSGSDDYDMICDTMMGMMPLIPENLYLALDDYIDISHEWWDQNANELLTLNDKHYLPFGRRHHHRRRLYISAALQ